MNEPRSEYDYGTAAIMLAYGTVEHNVRDLNRRARRAIKVLKIERYHAARADRTAYAKAARWVFRTYPQHFAVMR